MLTPKARAFLFANKRPMAGITQAKGASPMPYHKLQQRLSGYMKTPSAPHIGKLGSPMKPYSSEEDEIV